MMNNQIGDFDASVEEPQVLLEDRRRRERNTTLDWDGIDMENARRLKQAWARAKAVLTRTITHISDALPVDADIMDAQTMQDRLLRGFSRFKEACDQYKDMLVDDVDIEESIAYLHEAETRYLAANDRISLWLQCKKRSVAEEKDVLDDVDPKDSVSQANSRSSRSSSSRHSKLSNEAQQFRNAARLASLRAEASLFEQRQSIANEELKISQMKKRLELETQMAKLEAEEKICVDFRLSVVKEPYEELSKLAQRTTLHQGWI